jgi:hypothetical protein
MNNYLPYNQRRTYYSLSIVHYSFTLAFLCLLSSIAWAQTISEPVLNRCGTVVHEQILQQRNPNRLRQLTLLNMRIQQAEAAGKSLRQAADNTVYRIPVVVHVIHSTASGTIGGTNNVNISDEQIRSQIEVLNEDYRRKAGTAGYNTSPIGADAGIEFFLATTDPDGQPSNGITRHYYAQKSSFSAGTDDDLLLSQIAYWPSNRYLNIWVTKIDNYLGYTYFPTAADTLKGLAPSTDERTDGSIIDYRVFGRKIGTVTSSLYGIGRTATHEIGHWLGLFHPNGDTNCGDDYVVDTPPTDNLNQTSSCNDLYSNCSGTRTRELIENYLMYSPDACMNMFTAGQVARMRNVLTLSPRRAQLLRSVSSPLTESETLTITVYPNPTTADPSVDVQLKGFQSFSVDLFDMAGRQLRTIPFSESPSTRVMLPVTGLARGIYIVRVKTDNEVASKRLLVQ